MANLLLFRRPGLAIAAAAVLSLSGGDTDVVLKLNPSESSWPNLVFRTRPNAIAVETASLAFSAADLTLTAAPATIVADEAAVLTLSAADIALAEVLTPDAAVLALSAADPTLVQSAVTVTVDAPATFALSAADIGLTVDLRRVTIYINGVDRSALCQLDAQSLDQQVNGHTGAFSIVVNGTSGFVPTQWMEVAVYQGSVANILFGGVVQTVDLLFPRENLARADYRCACVGMEFLAARTLVFERYQGLSATAIAQALAAMVPGFSADGIQAGLPVIDDIEFHGESIPEALALVAQRLGATSYIGADKKLNLAFTETDDAPQPLSPAHPFRELTVSRDASQVRNRTYAAGTGSPVSAAVAAGDSMIPVQAVAAYQSGGGQAIIGTQVVDYGGVSASGAGSTADGPLASPAGPTSAVATVSAGKLGTYRHAVSCIVEGRGETELSALSAPVTVPVFSPPVAGTGGVQHDLSGGGVSVVLFRSGSVATIGGYAYQFLPGSSVTISGSAGGAFDGNHKIGSLNSFGEAQIGGFSELAPSITSAVLLATTAGPLVGTASYRMVYESADGPTTGGTLMQVNGLPALLSPFPISSNPYSIAPGTIAGGALTAPAAYYYYMSVVTDTGEGAFAAMGSVGLGESHNSAFITFAACFDARCVTRRIYRAQASDPLPRLVTTIGKGAGSYVDGTAYANLGALPRNTVLGSAVGLRGLPVPTDPRVKRKGLYRQSALDGVFRRVADLPITQLWFFDVVNDTDLGDAIPATSEFGGAAIDVTVLAGPVGTTSYRVWSTKDGGTELFLAGTISAPGVFRDTRADVDLVDAAHTTSRMTTLAGATQQRVKDATAFSVSGGWFRSGSQVVRFGAKSGNTLTGIPASGPGSITAPISADAEVVVEPHLTGVTGLTRPVAQGEQARIWVQVDDAASQAAIAALDPLGFDDGVREHKIENPEWSYATCLLAAQADVDQNKNDRITITFKRSDYKLVIGKTMEVDLPAPVGITDATSFRITNLSVAALGVNQRIYAERTVTISNAPPVSFDDYLRRLLTPAA